MKYNKILIWLAASCALVLVLFATAGGSMVLMPGKSYQGALPKLDAEQLQLLERLRGHVMLLAGKIGERNPGQYGSLVRAADYVKGQFTESGIPVRLEPFTNEGKEMVNLVGELKGSTGPEEIVVIGAHYDSAPGTPGANDNASGVAALLELARQFANAKPVRTVRFIAFANEEPPYFQRETMGSMIYARRARERGDKIVAMVSLETIGYYCDEPKSQQYPAPLNHFYPDTGNFIGFVSDLGSRELLHKAIGAFRATTQFPSEGVASPAWIPGIGWSDQWSFWQVGYPAIMVTDTAPFRYPHYHEASDTPEKLDYERMTRVVRGLTKVVAALASD